MAPPATPTCCAKCSQAISDAHVFLVGDRPHHEKCVQCAKCDEYLDQNQTLISRPDDSDPASRVYYCKKDYFSLFGPKCPGCDVAFAPEDPAVKVRQFHYHPGCLNCQMCKVNLTSSTSEERLQLSCSEEGSVYCEEHWFMAQLRSSNNNALTSDMYSASPVYSCSTSSSSSSMDSGIEADAAQTGPASPGSPRAKSPGSNHDGDAAANGNDSDSERKDGDAKDSKRRGPRTTIKAKQLEVLRSTFAQNPKPSRVLREHLAKETGLPMRVIQVWFQNKRSKEKRMHQMRFMVRPPGAPFMSSAAAARRFGAGGADPRSFCFPPNAVAYDYAPGGFGGGPGGDHMQAYMPQHLQAGPGGPYVGEHMPPSMAGHMGSYPMDPEAAAAAASSSPTPVSPLHSFPSPPPQVQDYQHPVSESDLTTSTGSTTSTSSPFNLAASADSCYPSPPLSLEYPPVPISAASASAGGANESS